MGRGNVCVTGPYEGLFYIDNDDLLIYRHRYAVELSDDEKRFLRDIDVSEMLYWEYSEIDSDCFMDGVEEQFIESMQSRFKSFYRRYDFFVGDARVCLENELFYVAFEDNQWSMAVKLLQKEHWCYDYAGLQKQHYQRYLDGIRDALFEQFETLGTYTGAWTSGTINRKEFQHGKVHTT